MGVVKDWITYGLKCRILDGSFKNFNGYVAVPRSHPAWERDYDKLDIQVHGGLTFGQQGVENDRQWDDPELWWFGFDTAHAGDKIYYSSGEISDSDGHYWTVEEVAEETENMARQFAEIKEKKEKW